MQGKTNKLTSEWPASASTPSPRSSSVAPAAGGEDLGTCGSWLRVSSLSDLGQRSVSIALVGVDFLQTGLGCGAL